MTTLSENGVADPRARTHHASRDTRGMTAHSRNPSARYPARFDADGVPAFFQLTPAQYEALVSEVMDWRQGGYAALRQHARRVYNGFGPSSSRFKAAVRQAIHRGHAWTIRPAEYDRLVSSPCYRCGAPTGSGCGLDRLDNARGYDLDNVRPCCGPCNLLNAGGSTHVLGR